jgi:hypothetical protein
MYSFSRALGCRGFVLLNVNTQGVTGPNSIESKTIRSFEIEMIFLNFLKIINFNWVNKMFFIYLSNGYIKIKVEHSVLFI